MYIGLALIANISYGQILPGTLDVTGFPSMSQTVEELVKEAGADDNGVGFESTIDATLITFILDSSTDPITGATVTSSQNCSENIYRYSVYMHTVNAPQNMLVEAKTTFNSGVRFPTAILYDDLSSQPLGPRDLRPENGGAYIQIPNDGSTAIKVFEFVGCREDIPIQFRVKPSVLDVAGLKNLDVYYTVVGSLN
ncbi:MAG: hypothetical protein RIG62_14720 [Cyclobacteriaceae bacterium]